MLIDITTLAGNPSKARTNTLIVDLPLPGLAHALYAHLGTTHPYLHWHWQPAPTHTTNLKFEERLEAERQDIYITIFGHYDADNAKFLKWRRVRQGTQDWLLCAVYSNSASNTMSIQPPLFNNMGQAALTAWVELQCLWSLMLAQPVNQQAWSDTCGPGAAWYVGLQSKKGWSSAFRVDVHVAHNTSVTTHLGIVLVEQTFRDLPNATSAQTPTSIAPTTRVGQRGQLLAWSRMYLGHRVPTKTRRPAYTPSIQQFWTMKWSYYNALSDALYQAITATGSVCSPEVFTASHVWTAPKITSSDVPPLAMLNVVDLSFANAPLDQAAALQSIGLGAPAGVRAVSWSNTLPPKGTHCTPTLVIQPSRMFNDVRQHCWYLDQQQSRQWVDSREKFPIFAALQKITVDPYSSYKMSLLSGPLDTRSSQAICIGNFNKHTWGKTMRELFMQSWWIGKAPMELPDCTLRPQTFAVVHVRKNQHGAIGVVHVHLEWTGAHLRVTNIVRQRFPNVATLHRSFPGISAVNAWWLQADNGDRLECTSESLLGFMLRGDKHPNVAALRACVATARGPRQAAPGKTQKLVSDPVLSRSAKDELLPYYSKPGVSVARYLHKHCVYLQEEGQRLRVFVPPYGPLESLDGFRQFRVVRLWSATSQSYATWGLNTATPDLLYWYLRTLTWDLLQLNENSQMSLLEKIAKECQMVE